MGDVIEHPRRSDAGRCDYCHKPGTERVPGDPNDAPFCVEHAAWLTAYMAGQRAASAEFVAAALETAVGLTRDELHALVDGDVTPEGLDRERDLMWWGRLELTEWGA